MEMGWPNKEPVFMNEYSKRFIEVNGTYWNLGEVHITSVLVKGIDYDVGTKTVSISDEPTIVESKE